MSATSLLMPKPKRGEGVKRLNRWPIYIAAAGLAIIILVISYTYSQRMARQQEAAAAASTGQTLGAGSHAKDMFAVQPQGPRTVTNQTQPTLTPAIRDTQATGGPSGDLAEDARKKAWAAYYQQVAALEQAKAEAAGKALVSDTDAINTGTATGGQAGAVVTPGVGGSAGAAGGLPSAGVDANAQAEKRAFLAQGGDPLGLNEDLQASPHGMKIDTIMQGTAIPGIMVGGLTSDMPGMVVGEVSQNVYDTAGGNDLLIPQGSRVVGQYDNSVSNGQSRIGVIWNRIIFPDTSSLQLGSMEGADQGGYAGFKDLLDQHFWEKFAAATVISIAGAAAQVAQPQQSAFSGYSPTSVASGQLTQGYSQLGQEYARAGLSISNTIEIRPGYQFVIMCAKDVHLPIYVDHRTARPKALSGPILQ